MQKHEIEANEQFFLQLIRILKDNGKWVWKDRPYIVFTKDNGKLRGDEKGYNEVGEIVSQDFLEKHFTKG